MQKLWTELYRSKKISDYVFKDEKFKKTVVNWIQEKSIPNILLSGKPGTGKTTLAHVIFHELDVDRSDILHINASSDNGIDAMRGIENFCTVMPNGDFRYVLLDEADFVTPNGQASLRTLIETYHKSVRFILTCNYPERIIPALHSRLQSFHIESLDKVEYQSRLANILIDQGVDFGEKELEILDDYVRVCYPDLRKAINTLQQNTHGKKLAAISSEDTTGKMDYVVEAVAMFKIGRIMDARKLICSKAQRGEYEEIFGLFYRNLDWWGKSDNQQNKAIIVIANRLRDHALVADPEINLAACLIELEMIANES